MTKVVKISNDITKWIIVALAIGGLIFNTAIVYNEVKHNAESILRIERDVKDLRNFIMQEKK